MKTSQPGPAQPSATPDTAALIAAASPPVGPLGAAFAVLRKHAPAVLTIAALLLVWQGLVWSGRWSALYVVPPSAIVKSLREMALNGELMENLSVSLYRILAGFGVGAGIGLTLGLALGLSRLLDRMFSPIVAAIYPLPKLAILPLLVFWFGMGEGSKVALIALGTFFYACLNTYTGVRLVDPILIKAARNLAASRAQIVRTVILPGALPMTITGLKLAAGYSLALIVAAEMIAANTGLGHFVLLSGQFLQTDRLMAGVVVFGILGILANLIMDLAERWLAPWRH